MQPVARFQRSPVRVQAAVQRQQRGVNVLPGDSESSLSARVQRQEHRIYSQAIDWFARGRLRLREQRAWLDGRPLEAPLIATVSDEETECG